MKKGLGIALLIVVSAITFASCGDTLGKKHYVIFDTNGGHGYRLKYEGQLYRFGPQWMYKELDRCVGYSYSPIYGQRQIKKLYSIKGDGERRFIYPVTIGLSNPMTLLVREDVYDELVKGGEVPDCILNRQH